MHQRAGALDDGQSRMAFVQVADFGIGRDRFDDAPAGDAEHQILQQPHLDARLVKPAGDAAIGRAVERVIAVEKVELHAPDLCLPHPEQQPAARKIERNMQPAAIPRAGRTKRHRAGIVGGKGFLLPAVRVENLPKVALAGTGGRCR